MSFRIRTMTARIVEQTVGAIPPVKADVAYAALADSIPPGPARQAAFVALARGMVVRGDTASGRSRLVSLLAGHRVERRVDEYFDSDLLIPALVMSGAVDEASRWARGRADVFERASALLTIGTTIQARANIGHPWIISNGPDMCRDEF